MEIYKIKITPQAQRQMSEVYSYINENQREVHITSVIYAKRNQIEQLKGIIFS